MKLLNSLLNVNHQVFSASDPLFEVCKDIRLRSYVHSYGDTWPAAVGDAYDEQAIHFLASINGKPLATARMLLHNAQFEVEEHYPLTEFRNKGVCAEVSRLAVDPSARNSVLAASMFHAFYRIWLRNNAHFIFCGVPKDSSSATIYETFGFMPISPQYRHALFGIACNIQVLDLPAAVQHLDERQPRLMEIYRQPIDGID